MIVKRAILILFGALLLVGMASSNVPTNVNITSDHESTGSTGFPWLVANNIDSSNIHVVVTDAGSAGVKNATVTFSVTNPVMGTMSPVSFNTGNDGIANSVFRVKTKSGDATIKVDVYYSSSDGTYVNSFTINQKIDHDNPYVANFIHSAQGTVASEVPFTVFLTDRWGNAIDNRKATIPSDNHVVSLHVNGPSPNDCGFNSSGSIVHDITLTVDSNGNASAKIKLTSKAGDNNILMDPMGSIMEQQDFITAVSNGIPFSIVQVWNPDAASPSYPTVIADGHSTFMYAYSLYDKYGNPTQQQDVWINSTAGDQTLARTMMNGQIWGNYGPFSFTGIYNITATAAQNSSVTISKAIRFYNNTPTNIELYANPLTMPSIDSKPGFTSNVTAIVVDQYGNPVSGELVTFTLDPITSQTPLSNVTSGPAISSGTMSTDANGLAIIQYTPGAFQLFGRPGYVPTATGTSKVTATWRGIQRDIDLVWKNYPYLSAFAVASPARVNVSDDVDVYVKLTGDGWALQQTPADIVIVTDLAGGIGGPQRMANTIDSEKAFVQNMSDHTFISLVSFGRSPAYASAPYASAKTIAMWNDQKNNHTSPFQAYSGAPMDKNMVDPLHWYPAMAEPNVSPDGPAPFSYLNPDPDAKIEMDFSDSSQKAALLGVIGGYQDWGGTNYGSGLNAAIQEFSTHGTPGHSKTIIIMGDGVNMMAPNAPGSLESYWPSDWYPRKNLGWMDESEIGRAAAVDAANRAKAQGITIYAIGFCTPIPGYGCFQDTALMTQMASPGNYYAIPDTSQMTNIFLTILGKVQTEAGVDTGMVANLGEFYFNGSLASQSTANPNFTYVSYNGTIPALDGAPPTNPGSTWLRLYNRTAGGVFNLMTVPGYASPGQQIRNDSTAWATDQTLRFNIGTIYVNQTWETNFRFKVIKEGQVTLFGPNTHLTFNDSQGTGVTSMALPNVTWNGQSNPLPNQINYRNLTLSAITGPPDQQLTTNLPVHWSTTYSGTDYPVIEDVSYLYNGGTHYQVFKTLTLSQTDILSDQTADLSMDRLPPGSYAIRVYAHTNDAADIKVSNTYTYGTQGRSYIKLE